MKINQTSISVVRGSLLDQDVQAVVNAANEAMRGGGGIDGLIHHGAGPALLAELKNVAPRGTKTGEAILTRGHDLKQPFVIHTPGPVWSQRRGDECAQKLASCYRNSMAVADSEGMESIGFPSISTGVYGYPIEQAAPVALYTVFVFLNSHPDTVLRRVVFAMYGEKEFEVFDAELRKRANASLPA